MEFTTQSEFPNEHRKSTEKVPKITVDRIRYAVLFDLRKLRTAYYSKSEDFPRIASRMGAYYYLNIISRGCYLRTLSMKQERGISLD